MLNHTAKNSLIVVVPLASLNHLLCEDAGKET
jgi:hypothetical protein